MIHQHRVGDKILRRVSELVIIEGQPKALLGWIDFGGVRTPIYLCNLDFAKLHRSASSPNTFCYEESRLTRGSRAEAAFLTSTRNRRAQGPKATRPDFLLTN